MLKYKQSILKTLLSIGKKSVVQISILNMKNKKVFYSSPLSLTVLKSGNFEI